MKKWTIGLSLILFFLTAAAVAHAVEKPNVILIFADDLGPGMLSCNGQEIVTTPHIDRLADEGIMFDNYYGGVFCAPARWSLLAGMHDGRIGGFKQTRAGLPIKRDSGEITEAQYQKQLKELKANAHPIAENEVFLAEVARQAGYKTAQFGKLDRGFLTWHERVKRFGWDFYEGMYDHIRCHGFFPPYIWRNGEKVELEGNDMANCAKTTRESLEPVGWGGKTYSADVFVEGILKYIREHGEAVRSGQPTKPFFIYHPTQLPHGPVSVPYLHADYENDSRMDLAEKKYATMVKMLDDHVGLIMSELKAQGLDEDTVVFFASDNGHEMNSGPFMDYNKQKSSLTGEKFNLKDNKFRTSEHGDIFNGAGGRAGLKRSGYQGGIQCVMMVRWPGKVPAGRRSMLLTAHYDFMATLADLGGVAAPSGKDGLSFLPTMLGQSQAKTHDYVVVANTWRIMGGSSVMTRDGWKLIQNNKTKGFQLYNIREDNEERFELSAKYPERTEHLKKLLLSELNSERPDL